MLKTKTGRNSNCELCSLWESAETICLWGKGPSSPELMILLEAPGLPADRGGEAISGPAGKLLKELLTEADIKNYYVTHAVRCKPPEGESPSAAQLKACKDYLVREIRQVKPQWILTLGAGALKSLSRGKITALHGSAIPLEVSGHPFNLYPSFHPAVALRDPTKIPALKQDIKRLGKLMKGESSVGQQEIHWKVIRTMTDWNSFIEEFAASPEVAIDTETTGLDREDPNFEVNALQIGLASGRNFAIPFMVRQSPWNKKFQRMFLEQLIELSKDKKIVMQNGKFDNLNLRKKYGVQFFLTFDTMLAHHLLDENSPHGLDAMAMAELDAPNWDIDLNTKLGLGDLEKFYKYGCQDVYYTLQLYYIFRARFLKQAGLRRLFYKLVMPAARVFEDIEQEGHFINLKRLQEVENKLTMESLALLEELQQVADINWNSPAQIGELFFNQLGMPVLEKTPSGAPSTAESTLLRLEHPVAKALMKYRGVEKNLSTYIIGWKELMHGDRLFLSTKLHGTVTGRWASRLHQVPRDPMIRSIIDAPPGKTLVVADYSQIELRLVAMVSGDQRMRMVFQTGGDIHAATASEILGKDPSKLTKEERKMGKPVNFGFIYGMWHKKFGIYARDNYGVIFSERESERYRERFFEVYNAIPKWHDRMKRTADMFGEVISLSGRIRHLPGVNSTDKKVQDEAKRQGINCVDELTECLEISKGWITQEHLKKGDRILTKNKDTGSYEWNEVLTVNRGTYKGTLYSLESRSISALTTPEHRWLVTSGSHDRWLTGDFNTHSKFKTSRELDCDTSFRIHCSGYPIGTLDNLSLSDDLIRLLGWIVTEGHFKKNKKQNTYAISLCQSFRANPEKVKEIENLLKRLGVLDKGKIIEETQSKRWTIYGDLAKKVRDLIPNKKLSMGFITSLSSRQIELLVDSMFKGDGSYKEFLRSGKVKFGQKLKSDTECFQILYTLLGKSSSLQKRDQTHRICRSDKLRNKEIKGIISWNTVIRGRKFFHNRDTRKGSHFRKIETSGQLMWCPTVENSTFIARRNGSVYVTANSPIQGFGSGDLKAMAMVEIHDTFEPEEVSIKGEVHDSILMWMDEDKLEDLIPQVKSIMESPRLLKEFKINMTVPLVADFEVGPWGLGKKWEG